MDECISYNSQFYEYLIPSPAVFQRACLSFDRTDMFIVSIIRMIFWFVILLIFENTFANIRINVTRAVPLLIVRYILYAIVTINILYVGMVVAKNPVLSMGVNESVLGYKYRNSRKENIPYEADYS